MSASPITTHVLDTARGRPAQGVAITLEVRSGDRGWREMGRGVTDADGRLRTLLAAGTRAEKGIYRITFHTAEYYGAMGTETFFPEVSIVFEIREPSEHHHVPLLLSPYGYSTYRGS